MSGVSTARLKFHPGKRRRGRGLGAGAGNSLGRDPGGERHRVRNVSKASDAPSKAAFAS